MSTRGTVRFKLETIDGKVEELAEIGIGHDAYPSGLGAGIVEAVEMSELAANPEKLVLKILKEIDGDPFFDDEYVYELHFKERSSDAEIRRNSEWITKAKIVGYSYKSRENDVIYEGDFAGFKEFCRRD
jgi:hypothetical protein